MEKLQIVEPHVELITPRIDPEWASRALLLIEECGRVSHKSEGRIKSGSAEPFIRKVAIQWGHDSILEHASFTVCFVGSRSMSHQLVRHRIAAYTQESQRFCDYSGDSADCSLKVIVPPTIGHVPAGSSVFLAPSEIDVADEGVVCERLVIAPPGKLAEGVNIRSPLGVMLLDAISAYRTYQQLREMGTPAEDARSILPNATKTEVYTTFNLREWRHFFKMRMDEHAQWEIKLLAKQVFEYFQKTIPVSLEDLHSHSGHLLS